ncbi:S8 family serine peptidase [Parapedobacter soli]
MFAQSVRFPASHANVIGVGAMNPSNQRADFSNWGNGIDILKVS